MKKRILAITLCVLILAAFTGCAASSNTSAGVSSEQMVSPESQDNHYDIAADTEMAAEEDAVSKDLGETNLPQPVSAPSSNEKIIYSADAELETRDFDKALKELSALLEKYGGFVENSSISGSDYYTIENDGGTYRTASFTYRIPVEGFAAFCDEVKALGNVPSFSTYAENVTSQYADIDARLTARTAEEQRLLELLNKAETVEEMLQIESALSDIRYEIESLQGTLNDYDARISCSTLSLNVKEVTLYTNVTDGSKGYGDQLSDGFSATLAAVGQFFSNAFKWIVTALPVLLILAAVGLAIFLIVRHALKKKKSAPNTQDKKDAPFPPTQDKKDE